MKNSLKEKLYRWLEMFKAMNNGEDPRFLPLTKEEIEVLVDRSSGERGFFTGGSTCRFMGIDAKETSFAVMQRQRMLTMPVAKLREVARVDLSFEYVAKVDHECARYLHRKMVARICTDTTNLFIRLEWDPLAKLKRALRITKWFPVKSRTVAITGTVLYPYLAVTLPHNTHHVQFSVTP